MLDIEARGRDAAFHFSVEEYFTQHVQSDEPVMMVWRAEPCVMLGQYQVAAAEVNMGFAQKEGIQIVRRSSGGGAIFADLGTLLFTMIAPCRAEQSPQQIARETVATAVIEALNQMGITAKLEGRNDILVDGRKVTGLAQYARNGWLCTHGSLLYDADLEVLVRSLHVDQDKIQSKAISSVRSRVSNLKAHMKDSCSTQAFYEMFRQKLFEGPKKKIHTLSTREIEEIDRIYHAKYGNPVWVFEKSPKFSFHNGRRFTAGKVDIYLDVVKGTVSSASIRGDFLGTVLIRGLEEQLEGCAFQYQAMGETLDKIALEPYLGGITKEELLSCMFE